MNDSTDFKLEIQEPPKRQNVKNEKPDTLDAHERQGKDFLTAAEMDIVLKASRKGKFGSRDHCMFLLMYRHGLRVSELIGMRRSDVSLDEARVFVRRKKDGLSTSQPLDGEEIRALRAYLRTRSDDMPWLFISMRRSPFTRQALNYLVSQVGERAGFAGLHPHMFRHSCGHALANKGTDTRLLQDWLGHRDIRHTAHYTRTSAKRFEGIWG